MAKRKTTIREAAENLITINTVREDTLDETGQRIDELTFKIKTLEEQSKSMKFVLNIGQIIIIGVVIVLFICVATLIIDAYRFKGESYITMKESIEDIRSEFSNTRYEIINQRISDVEETIYLSSNPTSPPQS